MGSGFGRGKKRCDSLMFGKAATADRLSPTLCRLDSYRLRPSRGMPQEIANSGKSGCRSLAHCRNLGRFDSSFKGAGPTALDGTASSSAAGQSEAKNCPPFVQSKIAKGRAPGDVSAL